MLFVCLGRMYITYISTLHDVEQMKKSFHDTWNRLLGSQTRYKSVEVIHMYISDLREM